MQAITITYVGPTNTKASRWKAKAAAGSITVSYDSGLNERDNVKDSDVTLVVALTGTHKGGGTLVHTGPFTENILVPQLPVGHGMFFNGKANRHYGMPVIEGERNLLVHWSEVK